MEPADLDQMRTALEEQGTLLNRHQSQFEAVHRSLGTITGNITSMATQLQQIT